MVKGRGRGQPHPRPTRRSPHPGHLRGLRRTAPRPARPVHGGHVPGRRRHLDNMDTDEVIANRGLELMGYHRGEYTHLHPNDHVNRSQSTSDAYPAIKLAVLLAGRSLPASDARPASGPGREGAAFHDVLKMGRTENQDAVPMTLGQEFSAYAVMIDSAIRAIDHAAEELLDINMGATAIGTGITSPPGYADLVTARTAGISGFPLRRSAQPGGGHPERRHLRANVRRPETGRGADLQDLQRPAAAQLRPALRSQARSTCRPCSRAARSCPARSTR